MTLWRFLAAKKVAVEARAGDAADRARPPSGNARPRRIASVDFDCSSTGDGVASRPDMLSVNLATYRNTARVLNLLYRMTEDATNRLKRPPIRTNRHTSGPSESLPIFKLSFHASLCVITAPVSTCAKGMKYEKLTVRNMHSSSEPLCV